MKIIKPLLITLASMIGFGIIALLIVITKIDSSAFKSKISLTIQEQSGCQLEFSDNIRWKLLPHFGLTMQSIVIKNKAQSGGLTIAKVGNLDIRMKVMPLLTKKLMVDNIIARDLNLTLPKIKADKATLSFNLAAKPNTKYSYEALIGNGKFSLQNGSWQGADIGYILHSALALLNNRPAPTPAPNPHTNFGSLNGTFTIKNGLFTNRDFLLTAEHIKVTGAGTINLTTQTINYKLDATFTDNTAQEHADFSVPIKVFGPISHPYIQPDLTRFLLNSAKKTIRKLIDQRIKELPLTNKATRKILNNLPLNKLFNLTEAKIGPVYWHQASNK